MHSRNYELVYSLDVNVDGINSSAGSRWLLMLQHVTPSKVSTRLYMFFIGIRIMHKES